MRLALAGLLAGSLVSRALASDALSLPAAPIPYLLGGQVTVVWQHQPAFRSPYEGSRSLRPDTEDAVSHSYTLYTGARLLPWLDLYVDPEMIRGEGISGGVGLAGYTNGEVIRNPEAGQSPYLARAFLRATIPIGGESEDQERDLLQVGGPVAARRLVLTGGRAGGCRHLRHQPLREQHPDAVPQLVLHQQHGVGLRRRHPGYTRGGAAEWINPSWTIRVGAFQMPEVANGLDLDGDLLHSHGDQVEVEGHPTLLTARPMIVRAMGYENHARMGRYRDALDLAARRGGPPDITGTRRPNRRKYGFALNLEQPLSEDGDTGLFARLGWNDGATETFAYTEADWSLSLGAQIGGAGWRRGDDRVGVGVAANGLSDAHADYLAAGGLGFELGDGKLSYRPETIVETYYLAQVVTWAALTVDYQLIADPGHNRARGPVSVVSLRLHLRQIVGHE